MAMRQCRALFIWRSVYMNKALVLQAARFGDLVQSKRLVLSLQRKTEVHIALDRSLGDLARLIYPDVIVHELNFHGRMDMEAIRQNMANFKILGDIKFDKIYNCNFSSLTAAICRLFDRDTIAGYRPRELAIGGIERSRWARIVFALSQERKSACLNLADFWGYMDSSPIQPEKVNPGAKGRGEGVGIVLSGRESRRSLQPEALASIINIVFKALGGPEIKLLGSHAESPAARKLLRLLPAAISEKTRDLSGKTNWRQLVDEVNGLDMLVTPDTGIMHLAAHLGVPVMAFFLSSAWCHETGPYGGGHFIWQAVETCSPCLESDICPNNAICSQVFTSQAFARVLAQQLMNVDKDGGFPENLQLWRSGFDSLGARLLLQKGIDGNESTRRAARLMLANFQGFSANGLFTVAPDILRKLATRLFPPQDWMLPQERFC